jgi:hypothetical protein
VGALIAIVMECVYLCLVITVDYNCGHSKSDVVGEFSSMMLDYP